MACIFCQIIAGELPSEILFQDEEVIVIRDINPQAPKHLLVMPKLHIGSLAEVADEHIPLMGHLIAVANQMAKREGVSQSGYRLVINSGPQGGQVVPHLHVHVLGGRQLSGSMG